MSYRSANLGGVAHLGKTSYDGKANAHIAPEQTLCGITSDDWSRTEPRFDQWAHRRAGAVCPTCDRIALWETMRRVAPRWG